MGFSIGAPQTSTNEFIYNVYGRKFNFYIPHYDGGHVTNETNTSDMDNEKYF